MRWLPVILIFSLSISGCGVLDFLSGDHERDGSFRHFDNPSDLQTSFETSYTTCNPSDCPSFVVGLYAIDYNELGLRGLHSCSGTLISDRRILTNAHCVPKDLQRVGARCNDRIRFSFPTTAHYKSESIRCSRVVAISKDTLRSDEPDWAILEMARATPRAPVVINTQGVSSGQSLQIYKFDFDLDTRVSGEGVLVPTLCRGNTHYFRSGNSIGQIGPLVDVSHCQQKLIHGNSGSGLLNRSGELVGVLSSALFVEESSEDWAVALRVQYPEIRQNSGSGANLACIDYFITSPLSELCYFSSPQDFVSTTIAARNDREQRADSDSYQEGFERIREVYGLPSNRNMQWTDEVAPLLFQLQIPVEGEGAGQARALYKKYFLTHYPMFPECVPDIHPESFEGALLSLEPGDRVVDPTSLMATRSSELVEKTFVFTRLDEQTFRVEPSQGYFLSFFIERFLGVSGKVSIDLPVCP